MSNIPKKVLEKLREEYPEGCRVELLHMADPYTKLKPGDRGTALDVCDDGTIHVIWDSGFFISVVYGEDSFRKLDIVIVTCCGKTKTWGNRKEAECFFLEKFAACEGVEKENCAKVLLDLASGKTLCRDSDDSLTRFLRDEVPFRIREFFNKNPDDMGEDGIDAIVDELDNRADEIFDYDRIDNIIEGMLKEFEKK